MTHIYTPRQQRALLIASLLLIGGFIVYGLWGYMTAFLGAGILYVIFRPLFRYLVRKRGWNRRLTTMLVIITSLVVIILPFASLSLLLVGRIQYYSQNYGQILDLVHKAETITGYKVTDPKTVSNLINQGTAFATRQFPSILGSTLDFTIVLGLMYFALFFMFADEGAFLKGVRRYLPFKPDTLNELGESLQNNVNANVLGQGLVSAVQAAITGVTLWIFGVPDAAFWGVVTFFFSFVPILGSPFVWVPAALIKLSEGDTTQGIGILIVGAVVIVNIDNVLRVMLAKGMGNIHPFITLTGIILGIPLFGILGLVVGPLLLSYFIVLMNVFERQNKTLQAEMVDEEERLEAQADHKII
jgi:predicted PurR-regulated permease PerM